MWPLEAHGAIKPDAEPFEQHHEEGAREHRGQQKRLTDQKRTEKREDVPELGELLEPGLHRWPVVYGSIRSRSGSREVNAPWFAR